MDVQISTLNGLTMKSAQPTRASYHGGLSSPLEGKSTYTLISPCHKPNVYVTQNKFIVIYQKSHQRIALNTQTLSAVLTGRGRNRRISPLPHIEE
jgi:hypothetical protein